MSFNINCRDDRVLLDRSFDTYGCLKTAYDWYSATVRGAVKKTPPLVVFVLGAAASEFAKRTFLRCAKEEYNRAERSWPTIISLTGLATVSALGSILFAAGAVATVCEKLFLRE